MTKVTIRQDKQGNMRVKNRGDKPVTLMVDDKPFAKILPRTEGVFRVDRHQSSIWVKES